MPRDLADVLHYFIPETGEGAPASSRLTGSAAPADALEASQNRAPEPATGGAEVPLAVSDPSALPDTPAVPKTPVAPEAERGPLPILGIPIGDRDIVRAALAWNLVVETSRIGGTSVLLAPESDRDSPLWPEPGVGPLGSEILFCPATDLNALYTAAADLAVARAAEVRMGGIIFVRIPPAWLTTEPVQTKAVRWMLLMSSPNRRDLEETVAVATRLARIDPQVEVGLTVHGVQTLSEARAAFESASQAARDQVGLDLISYGLLVDDLNVYRAIAAQRPIGLAHPAAPATRAFMDVARLLSEDARSGLPLHVPADIHGHGHAHVHG